MDSSIKNKIKSMIENKDFPNISIPGTPGIGITTTSLCLAPRLLGEYYNKQQHTAPEEKLNNNSS